MKMLQSRKICFIVLGIIIKRIKLIQKAKKKLSKIAESFKQVLNRMFVINFN